MMKSGANKLDQSAIRQFAEKGNDAQWISQKMQIPLVCIENFMPKKEMSPQQRGAITRKANEAAVAMETEGEGAESAAA